MIVSTHKWEELFNDLDRWDLLYTEVLKNEKSNYLRDLSRRRFQIRIIYFLLHHCVSLVLVKSIFSTCIFWAQSRIAYFDWHRVYYYCYYLLYLVKVYKNLYIFSHSDEFAWRVGYRPQPVCCPILFYNKVYGIINF